MKKEIWLQPMTAEMYHAFFKEYQNDRDLYLDQKDYRPYVYSEDTVNAYIGRQIDRKRMPFAIMCGDEIVGELKLYDIEKNKRATLGIAMKNEKYKDRGFGTQTELLAIDYVFHEMDIPVLYADSVLTNTRSQHVLEKVGFRLIGQDEERRYYRITRDK